MNQKSKATLALDVGEKRIGIAVADGAVRIARPIGVVEVDGDELSAIVQHVVQEQAVLVVVGYPRNQSGEATAQTSYVEEFARRLGEVLDVPLLFQDESLTSVLAEQRLKSYDKPYTKGDIDALAAALILQDYVEQNSGRI